MLFRSLGALDLAAVSLTLEQAIRDGEGVQLKMDQFEEALQLVLHSLTTLTGRQQDLRQEVGKSFDFDKERNRLMADLQQMLVGKNFQAAGMWQELKPLLTGVDNVMLMQIDSSLTKFDYSTALKLLASLQVNDADRR